MFEKGYTPWNKGLTKEIDERVRKRSLSLIGHPMHTEQYKKRVSEMMKGNKYSVGRAPWNKGKKLPQMSGTNHPIYGKHLTLETKLKISQSRHGQVAWNKGIKGRTSPRKGKHLSEETKIKLSKSLRDIYVNNPELREKMGIYRRGKVPWNKGKKTGPLTIEHIKKCLRRRTLSSLEKKMIEIINKLNLPYSFVGNGKFFIERKNPDFINTNGEKIAIEVFYKRHKELFRGGLEQWKQERIPIFEKYGWKLLFFDETQVNETEILRRIG